MEDCSVVEEKTIKKLYDVLYRLVGHHRRLLELVRHEKTVLVDADLHKIREATHAKEVMISEIRQAEGIRLKLVGTLVVEHRRPAGELTLPNIIVLYQGEQPEVAAQLSSVFNTLKILIQRITEQNQENQQLVEQSLKHIRNMKDNAIGEADPYSKTYSKTGTTVNRGESRLISQKV